MTFSAFDSAFNRTRYSRTKVTLSCTFCTIFYRQYSCYYYFYCYWLDLTKVFRRLQRPLLYSWWSPTPHANKWLFHLLFCQHQAVSFILAEMAMNIEIGRLSVWRASSVIDQGKKNTYYASISKVSRAWFQIKSSGNHRYHSTLPEVQIVVCQDPYPNKKKNSELDSVQYLKHN